MPYWEKIPILILSAGYGKRMKSSSTPKPLLKLLGMPILEHILKHFPQNPIYMVYHHPKVQKWAKRAPFSISLIFNPHPEKENGYSFFLAREKISTPFLLVMGDHYYEKDFIEEVKKTL